MKLGGWCMVAGALIFGHGAALGGESVIDRMRTCATEADDAKRLACYDVQIGRTKSGPDDGHGAAGESTPREQEQAGATAHEQKQQAGTTAHEQKQAAATAHEQKQAAATAPPPEDLHGKVAAIANRGFGKFVVTLDDGQVWAQLEVPDYMLRVGDAVTIRPGVLGGLWMVGPSERNRTRVKRIQ